MSIIADALKKAEQNKKLKHTVSSSVPEGNTATSVEEELNDASSLHAARSGLAVEAEQERFEAEHAQSYYEFGKKKARDFFWKKLLFVALVVFVSGIVVATLYMTFDWLNSENFFHSQAETLQSRPTAQTPPAEEKSAQVPATVQTPQPPPALMQAPSEGVVNHFFSSEPAAQSVSSRPKKLPPFRLTGIYFMENSAPYAFVNGKVVKEGDRILNAEVKVIEQNRVSLSYRGQTINLKME